MPQTTTVFGDTSQRRSETLAQEAALSFDILL